MTATLSREEIQALGCMGALTPSHDNSPTLAHLDLTSLGSLAPSIQLSLYAPEQLHSLGALAYASSQDNSSNSPSSLFKDFAVPAIKTLYTDSIKPSIKTLYTDAKSNSRIGTGVIGATIGATIGTGLAGVLFGAAVGAGVLMGAHGLYKDYVDAKQYEALRDDAGASLSKSIFAIPARAEMYRRMIEEHQRINSHSLEHGGRPIPFRDFYLSCLAPRDTSPRASLEEAHEAGTSGERAPGAPAGESPATPAGESSAGTPGTPAESSPPLV